MTIAILMTAMAAQALSAPDTLRWEEAASDVGGRYAIAPATTARDGDRVRVLVRLVAANPEEGGTAMAVARYRFECSRRTWFAEAADMYRADGSLAASYDAPSPGTSPRAILAGQSEDVIRARVCGGR